MDGDYYLSNKPKFLKTFDRAAKHMRKSLASRYGNDFAETVLNEARLEFESLVTELPYIGGAKSPLTRALVESASCLALHRVLKEHGKTVEDTGATIDDTVRARLEAVPALLRHLVGKYRFSTLYLKKLRKRAARSQERTYPGDWVLEIVEGDGSEFDYGIDYVECGTCKLFRAHGAEELIPYLCDTDFPVSKALGTGLVRTTTLAEGADRCNFRFKKGREAL